MDSGNEENKGGILVVKWDGIKCKLVNFAKMTKKIGKDDPRRIMHSMKVGLAITLASLFFYVNPLYGGFKEAGMWAILTVVVAFEFTVGGTLSKSLNRGGATLVAAALGVGAEYLASLGGEREELFILAFLVFIIATASTFTRFFPQVKRRYDYGMLIFIVTFSLVAVSGSRERVNDIVGLARERLITILIGVSICIFLSISLCPVWAGLDLHNLVAANIQNLVPFLHGFGPDLFSFDGSDGDHNDNEDSDKTLLLLSYQNVLNSKAIEESLANFAWWEPPHGPFGFRHPWKQYLNIGSLTRECATQIQTLGQYCQYINSKPKVASELGSQIQEACTRMSRESGSAMKEVASVVKNMRPPSPALQTHIQNSKAAAAQLKTILHNFSPSPELQFQEIMPLYLLSSTLLDIITTIDKISVSVTLLSQMAGFRNSKATVKPCNDMPETKVTVVIDIHVPPADS